MKILIRFAMASLLTVLLLMCAGCLRSRLIVTTDPPGATVKVQQVARGKSPVTVPFIWYWYYDIDIEKEGYQPLHKVEYLRTPPYAYFPLDFIVELLPVPITDTRKRHYTLTPVKVNP